VLATRSRSASPVEPGLAPAPSDQGARDVGLAVASRLQTAGRKPWAPRLDPDDDCKFDCNRGGIGRHGAVCGRHTRAQKMAPSHGKWRGAGRCGMAREVLSPGWGPGALSWTHPGPDHRSAAALSCPCASRRRGAQPRRRRHRHRFPSFRAIACCRATDVMLGCVGHRACPPPGRGPRGMITRAPGQGASTAGTAVRRPAPLGRGPPAPGPGTASTA
jgi:hypothetical protein